MFSEGLYSSPHKAIEELVSNSFDAGATHVHVILAPDLTQLDATIAVVDDGTGMSPDGLRQHWLIGASHKRESATPPGSRAPIGKFGIGKLATFVLAKQLTHVCKYKSRYFATTMDYTAIPQGEEGGIHSEETVDLALRELTEGQARVALATVIVGTKPGYAAIELFGKGSARGWTVAIMSGLKPLADEIKKGRLSWVLRTAMPLRDDFQLYLDGDVQPPSKTDTPPLKRWVLGKDLTQLSTPAPDDLESAELDSGPPQLRYGLFHPKLRRITGYAEVYDSSLTEGKSRELGRSHGFFVYVRGRLVNIDDELFGMEALRHGTIRFRMVVHIDALDGELRSSREAVREGPLINIARNVLRGVFNHARNWLEDRDAKLTPGQQATGRIADTPWSLTRRPLLGLLNAALDGKIEPRHLVYPTTLVKSAREKLHGVDRAQTDAGLVLSTELVELSQQDGIAVLDIQVGALQMN